MNIDKFGRFGNVSSNKQNNLNTIIYDLDNLRKSIILLKSEMVTMYREINERFHQLQTILDNENERRTRIIMKT